MRIALSLAGSLSPDTEVFSPDGRELAVLAYNGQLVTLDVQTFLPIGPVVTFQGDTRGVLGDERLAFSPDNNSVAHQNPQGTWLVNWRTGEQWRVPDHPDMQGAIVFSPDGKTLASANDNSESGEVQLWDVHSRRRVGAAISAPPSVTALSFAPDGKSLALGPEYKPVVLWDLNRGVRLSPSITGQGIVAFLPDGKRLLTNGPTGTDDYQTRLQLWDVASGSPTGPVMKLNSSPIRKIIFLGDGTRACSGMLGPREAPAAREASKLSRGICPREEGSRA